MQEPIYLEPNQVPPQLRRGYTGKKFKVVVTESVMVPSDAGIWDGGSRTTYNAIRTSDGAKVPMVNHNSAPWDASRRDQTVPLQPGYAVVSHSMFCGKDMGLTYYLHPTDAAPMLPAPAVELSPLHQLVLDYTKSRKSSYNGKDRYDMAREDHCYAFRNNGPWPYTRELWEAAKTDLATMGLLDKRGAITVAGRNRAGRVS